MVDFSITVRPIDLNLAEYYDPRIPFIMFCKFKWFLIINNYFI